MKNISKISNYRSINESCYKPMYPSIKWYTAIDTCTKKYSSNTLKLSVTLLKTAVQAICNFNLINNPQTAIHEQEMWIMQISKPSKQQLDQRNKRDWWHSTKIIRCNWKQFYKKNKKEEEEKDPHENNNLTTWYQRFVVIYVTEI